MPVYEVKHPLIQHKLGLMRMAEISTKQFRELASEVARYGKIAHSVCRNQLINPNS